MKITRTSTTKRRLTQDEWQAARRRWEGSPWEGFQWLAKEIQAAWGVSISRPAVRQMATKPDAVWVKGRGDDTPLPPAAKGQAPKEAKRRAAKIATANDLPQEAQAEPEQEDPDDAQERALKLRGGRTEQDDTRLKAANEVFAANVAKGLNLSDAYRVAFPRSVNWKPESVHTKASALAAHGEVTARIQELMHAAGQQNAADVALVLREYLSRLRADPRELTEIRVVPCRHCYGIGNRYQYTDGELADFRDAFEEKRQAALDAGRPDIGEFNEKGGGGYTVLKAPNDECPSCGGAGSNRVVLKDSRSYSAAALALFGGVKQTKEGIEIRLTDRTDVLDRVARHVGFMDEQPTVNLSVTINEGELDAIYVQAMAKAKEGEAYARGRMARLRDAGVKVDDIGSAG